MVKLVVVLLLFVVVAVARIIALFGCVWLVLLSWWFEFCLLCRFGCLLVVGWFDLIVLYWCCWFW